MLQRVYRVQVDETGANITRYRVVKIGTKFAEINPWPENYKGLGNVRVPLNDIFGDLESANAECKIQTAKVVEKLKAQIEALGEAPIMRDSTDNVSAPDSVVSL